MTHLVRGGLLLGTALVIGQGVPGVTAIGPVRRRFFPGLAGQGRADHVALSFDDGPDPASTPAFLAALERAQVRAAFFMLGPMARRAARAGRGHRDRRARGRRPWLGAPVRHRAWAPGAARRYGLGAGRGGKDHRDDPPAVPPALRGAQCGRASLAAGQVCPAWVHRGATGRARGWCVLAVPPGAFSLSPGWPGMAEKSPGRVQLTSRLVVLRGGAMGRPPAGPPASRNVGCLAGQR